MFIAFRQSNDNNVCKTQSHLGFFALSYSLYESLELLTNTYHENENQHGSANLLLSYRHFIFIWHNYPLCIIKLMFHISQCLQYWILFSIWLDSQLEVGLNAWCKIKRSPNDGGISQHQKTNFYNSAWASYKRAFKYGRDNLHHADEILKYVKMINWEHRKDATIDSITGFLQW